MSETPISPDDRLADALLAFTGCIGNALDDICSYGFTFGDEYVPFDPDPEDDCDEEAACSQAWVRVTGITPIGLSGGFGGDCGAVLDIGLEVGVIRCYEIPEDGEAPTASEVMLAGLQAIKDMNTIHCAALGCDVWAKIESGTWQPMGPLGGQYGGMWSFTVEI